MNQRWEWKTQLLADRLFNTAAEAKSAERLPALLKIYLTEGLEELLSLCSQEHIYPSTTAGTSE